MARPALARLQTTVPAVGAAVDELMNGLATYAGNAVIVLDDLHHVRGDEALELVARAVQHAPAQARFVACTRSDPAIGIASACERGARGAACDGPRLHP
jgi:ATP/maltotriose-dependent transcriptional regulator MalT